MSERKVDVAIIGGGTAGMVAYKQARRHTSSVVLIEGNQFGTLCARSGCMPSKLLIAAAEAAHGARQAGRFGVRIDSVGVDSRAVMARVKTERDRFVSGVLDSIKRIPDGNIIRAKARFSAPRKLFLDDGQRILADRIVIAVGSRTHVVPMLKAAGGRLITSDDVFEWDNLPGSVAIFGPGVIGLELGQALSRLGVRVRLFGVGGSVGSIHDDEIRKVALAGFKREFALDPDATVHEIREIDGGVTIRFDNENGAEATEKFDYLLAATGRRPNVDSLDLDKSGLALDERGVPLFDRYTMQCGSSPVWIAGDANSNSPLLHEAADEGRIAGANAGRYPEIRVGLRRVPMTVVFTDPQIATVGLTIQQVDRHCQGRFGIGSVSFENQGRSRVVAKNQGLLRVYGEYGTGLFMGAEMFGPAAEHIAHLLAWAVQSRLTVEDLLDMPFYHPVIEEGLRTALQDLNRNLRSGQVQPGDCMDCGPGV